MSCIHRKFTKCVLENNKCMHVPTSIILLVKVKAEKTFFSRTNRRSNISHYQFLFCRFFKGEGGG